MAGNTVRVNILGDSSKLQQAFGQGATAAEKFRARAELVAKAVVAALAFKAAQAVKDFVGDSIRAFSNLEESTNAVRATYGPLADDILRIGENSAQSFGLAKTEFNEAAVAIAGFARNIAGEEGDIVEVTESLIQRAADFASIHDIEVSQALETFQSTLAGQSRPIRQYGIDISDTAIKLHALETGLIDTDRQMSEGEKQMARYSLLLQETDQWAGDFARTADDLANKERIVNAELENSKALLGEIIAPLKLASLEMQSGFIRSINDATIALGGMTGELSDGEAALLSFKNETGRSAASVSDVLRGVELSWQSWTREIDVWADTLFGGNRRLDDMVEGLEGLIDQQDLTAEGVEDLRHELVQLLSSGELNEEQFEALSAVLDRELQVQVSDTADEVHRLKGEQKDLGDATSDTTDEIRTQADELRAQTDPLFAAMRHAQGLEEAQRALNDAIVEYGEDSQEAMDASRDVAREHAALMGVLEDLKTEGIDPTGDAARGMLEGMGIPSGTIDAIFREFDRIESNFEGRDFRLSISAPSIAYQQRANSITPYNTGTTAFQHGGIVTDPTLGLIGEAGSDEAVIPLNNEGIKILGAALREAMGGGVGINITVYAGLGTNGHDVGEQIVQEIEKARRRGIAV